MPISSALFVVILALPARAQVKSIIHERFSVSPNWGPALRAVALHMPLQPMGDPTAAALFAAGKAYADVAAPGEKILSDGALLPLAARWQQAGIDPQSLNALLSLPADPLSHQGTVNALMRLAPKATKDAQDLADKLTALANGRNWTPVDLPLMAETRGALQEVNRVFQSQLRPEQRDALASASQTLDQRYAAVQQQKRAEALAAALERRVKLFSNDVLTKKDPVQSANELERMVLDPSLNFEQRVKLRGMAVHALSKRLEDRELKKEDEVRLIAVLHRVAAESDATAQLEALDSLKYNPYRDTAPERIAAYRYIGVRSQERRVRAVAISALQLEIREGLPGPELMVADDAIREISQGADPIFAHELIAYHAKAPVPLTIREESVRETAKTSNTLIIAGVSGVFTSIFLGSLNLIAGYWFFMFSLAALAVGVMFLGLSKALSWGFGRKRA